VSNFQDRGIRVVQITDTHLFASPEGRLVGMNSEEGLHDVLALLRRHESEAAALLFTGDASQDHSRASYERLEQALSALGLPQYWTPGNHDELELLQAVVAPRHACAPHSVALGNWRLILLNSSVPGQPGGRLAESELDFLRSSLAASREAHILVCMHHNPVPVQAAWLQKHCLQEPEALFAVLDAEPRLRAVVFGHVHQELDQQRRGVRYLGAPSTCVQFHPQQAEFTLDDRNPGYRWLELLPDGRLLSGVRRVEGKRYDVDLSGAGY
jgi:Icc protein